MKVKVECIYCGSSNVKYAATVIKQDKNKPKEFYCKDCNRYFLDEDKK